MNSEPEEPTSKPFDLDPGIRRDERIKRQTKNARPVSQGGRF
jgi:hypothetical protein